MTNWNERINQFDGENRRQREEGQERIRKDQEEWERRVRQSFGLLDRLDVERMLREIRREIWKDGEVEPFEQLSSRARAGSIEKEKGVALTYKYQSPSEPFSEYTGKSNLKFGRHTVDKSSGGGVEPSHLYEEVTGFYREYIPKRFYQMEPQSISLSVFVAFPNNYHYPDEYGSLYVGTTKFPQSLDPDKTTDAEVARFLDQTLTADCSRRVNSKHLPADINAEVQKRLAELRRANISLHQKPR